MKSLLRAASAAAVLLCAASAATARITFVFDYSLDEAGGIFDASTANGRAAQAAMDRAAQTYTDRILDNLTAITPNSGETWSPQIVSPGTGATVTAPLTSEAANVITIYVGSRALSGTDVANTVAGFASPPTGSQAFINNTISRGQSGALASPKTDYGPWGGSIAFSDEQPWYFGASASGLTASRIDFQTVATHELEHLLGFSATQPSWAALVAGGKFLGANAVAANNGVAPTVTGSHWLNMMSTVGLGGPSQTTLMDSSIATGVRRHITQLDWAALDDIGWNLAMPGDANADGVVNFQDFQTLELNFGETNSRWSHGDFNEDGTVDAADLSLLLKNYGKQSDGLFTSPSGADEAAIAAFEAQVPEPGLGVIVVGAGAMIMMRRRRSAISAC
jgi:hypothetical protein